MLIRNDRRRNKMISCIVVNQSKVPNLIMQDVFRDIFYEDDMELKVSEDNKMIVFIHKVEKIKVWQTVLSFEVDQIPVGYGFGDQKEKAKENAFSRLKVISEMNIH